MTDKKSIKDVCGYKKFVFCGLNEGYIEDDLGVEAYGDERELIDLMAMMFVQIFQNDENMKDVDEYFDIRCNLTERIEWFWATGIANECGERAADDFRSECEKLV